MTITDRDLLTLTQTRVDDPVKIERALEKRVRRPNLTKDGRLFLVAEDHPARGALSAMGNPSAMGNGFDLLHRLVAALEVEGVDGVLASVDIIEDLALLGVLDDRMTAYDPEHIERQGLDGGKMLLRIALDDSGTATTIEPLPYERNSEGGVRLIRDQTQLLAAIAIASALGSRSAYSWLKVPAWSQMDEIDAATLENWQVALAQPTVRGLVVGWALLYPTSGDVHSAVSAAAKLVRP